MKKFVFAVAAIALAITLPSFAQDTKKETKSEKHSTGIIKAIDTVKGTLTITDKNGADKTFTIGEKTKISTADKKVATLADFKVSDKVKIGYTDVAGKITVIKIAPAPAEKATTPAPAAAPAAAPAPAKS